MWAACVVQRLGPPLARAVGGQLDAVAVGVGQVDGLVGAVVGGALDGGIRRRQTQRRPREFLPRGEQQSVVVEARVAPGARRPGLLVEDEQILLACPHCRLYTLSAVQPQADSVLVEGDRAVQVCYGQVDGAESERRG